MYFTREKKMLPSFRNSFFQQVLLDENNLHVKLNEP